MHRSAPAVPWEGESFIDQPPFGYPIRPVPKWKVRVSARCSGLRVGQVYRKHGFRQFDLAKSGNRVPKNRNLQFRAKTDVPQPHDLYWKVRNGGKEAADLGQLRGEITRDGGGNLKTEHTAYKGAHFVECYIVKDGAVVARDHQTVIVT